MLPILLSLALGAPGDVVLQLRCDVAALTGPQATALRDVIVLKWPTITASQILEFECDRTLPDKLTRCFVTVSDPLSEATLWAQLQQLQSVERGSTATERKRVIGPEIYAGAHAVQLRSLIWNVCPASNTYTPRRVHFVRTVAGAPIAMRAFYLRSYNSPGAWTYFQTLPIGERAEPIEIEQ